MRNGESTVDSTRRAGATPGRRFTSPAARRRAGHVMLAVAAVGVVVSLVGGVAGWLLVGSIDRSTRDSLTVTTETLRSVEDTIELVEQVLGSTVTSVDSAAGTLDAVAASATTAGRLVDEIDELTAVVGPTLDDTASTLRRLEALGGTIDGLLGDLSSVPFGPDYDPERGLGEIIGDLADDIAVLPDRFADTSTELGVLGDTVDDLADELVELADDVRAVQDGLDGSDDLVDAYRANVADARVVAERALEDLEGDITLMRWVLVIGAINLGVGQIVPFWVGRDLLERARHEPSTNAGTPSDR